MELLPRRCSRCFVYTDVLRCPKCGTKTYLRDSPEDPFWRLRHNMDEPIGLRSVVAHRSNPLENGPSP